jgi:AcrR family transcriptional regulator
MTRKKRDTSRKRESILDAAVRAFADEGYETTSTRCLRQKPVDPLLASA